MAQTTTVFGLLVKLEAVPGTAVALTDADYKLLAEPTTFEIDYVNEGERGVDPRGSGTLQNAGAAGRKFSGPVAFIPRGLGSSGGVYSEAVTPLDVHELRQVAGMTGTLNLDAGGLGIPGWIYRFSASAEKTASLRLYARKEDHLCSGAVCNDWGLAADAAGLVKETFGLMGACSLPSDGTAPNASAYSVKGPWYKFDGQNIVNFLLNQDDTVVLAAPKIRKWSIKRTGETAERPSGMHAGAFVGHVQGRGAVEVTVEMEAMPLATWNPYAAREAGTEYKVRLPMGKSGVAGQRARFEADGVQVTKVERGEDGPLALWTVTYTVYSNDTTGDPDCQLIEY